MSTKTFILEYTTAIGDYMPVAAFGARDNAERFARDRCHRQLLVRDYTYEEARNMLIAADSKFMDVLAGWSRYIARSEEA